jgi:hypothetical protein
MSVADDFGWNSMAVSPSVCHGNVKKLTMIFSLSLVRETNQPALTNVFVLQAARGLSAELGG